MLPCWVFIISCPSCIREISASFSSNRPSNLGCKSLLLRSSLRLLSCWEDLAVLQEMRVRVRHLIRNASSSGQLDRAENMLVMLSG